MSPNNTVEDEIFKVTHEQASITGAHLSAHGYAADLIKVINIELERVRNEYQFN
uniref:Uncharacterized protein n=1 Tax=Arion vulgaris TaxID=1028688 RepID=A0A0B7AA12_9EUPU